MTNDNENTPIKAPMMTSDKYLINEVEKVRLSLTKTRFLSSFAVLATVIYLGVITANFQQYIEPVSAAEMAQTMIAQKVIDSGPMIVDQVKQQIPVLIAQVPDYVKQQLPIYRTQVETQFTKDLNTNLTKGSVDLDAKLDTYFDKHKDEIKSALASGQDTDAVKKLGDNVSAEFLDSLKTTKVEGETIQNKLDSSLVSLQNVQKKMDRLANGKNLTAEEKKTRHSIALMTTIINRETPKVSNVAVNDNPRP